MGAAPAPRTAPQPQPGFAAGSLQVHGSPSPCPLTCWERSPGCPSHHGNSQSPGAESQGRPGCNSANQTGPPGDSEGPGPGCCFHTLLAPAPPTWCQPASVFRRQGCLEHASCSGHGIPEDAAVAIATKPAKPGARQGSSSEPQGWLPPLDSQTSQYKDVRSVCSPPVPGTHPTAAEGSCQPQLKPASDQACRPTLSSVGSGQRRRHPRLWLF